MEFPPNLEELADTFISVCERDAKSNGELNYKDMRRAVLLMLKLCYREGFDLSNKKWVNSLNYTLEKRGIHLENLD